MATLITNISVGRILLQTGVGVPNHVAPKGSQFTDVTTANLYINKDGIINWILNVDASNSGATSNIYSFNTFSSTTLGQTSVSTSIANDTIILSGIGLNILTDDVSNTLTFSSTTGTDTFVTGGTYNPSTGIASFTNNSGNGFDVTGITDNYWVSGSTGNYSIKAKNDSGLDATGNYAVAEGEGTLASGISSHAEGGITISSGQYSHAEGSYSLASGNQSHAEGFSTSATGITAHAEGNYTIAGGNYSHAEGNYTIASGNSSHAEGNYTIANGNYSHAEGESTIASGDYSHAGGDNSVASGTTSFVHSSNSFTNSDYSAILGGYNNIIPYGIINSIILGGDSITATTSGTTFVEGLNIKNTQNDNSITRLLTVDNTGLVKYRDVSTIIVSDTYVTGATYNNNIFTYTNNTGGTFNVLFNQVTGLTVNGDLSATTYYNLPTDIRVTGGTYSNGTIVFTNNTGGTFNVTGLFKSSDDIYTTGLTFNPSNYDLSISRNDGTSLTQNLAILATDMTVTGGTYNPSNGVATFTNNTGGTFTVSGFLTGMTDTYVTGFTYSDNLFTIKQNGQSDLTATINSMTGLTVNGGLSATTISATTYYNLPIDIYTTGGTYNNSTGTATFTTNIGNTFNVSGFYTGQTDTYVTGLTYSSNILTLKQTNSQPDLSVLINAVSGLTATTLYADYIDFNTNYTGASTQGRISWDNGTGTLNIGVGDVGGTLIDLQVGQEEIVRVFNSESTTLLKGEIVYVDGSQGNRPSVKRAIATGDGYSVTTLGMVDVNIAPGAEGYVTTFGIISNLNTLGLTGGTAIWLSPTVAGGYTSIKPQAPYHTVLIGYVVRVAATVGSVFINISNGWEIDELHDVRMNGKAIGDLVSLSGYNGSNVWVNTKTLNGSYTITGDTTVGGQMKSSTISATTYYNLPTDIYTTGGTYSNTNGITTFTNNTGGTFNITGYYTGYNALTGATYSNNVITFTNNTGNTSSVVINSMTGLTINGDLFVNSISATTYYNLSTTVSATTVSATTYYNLTDAELDTKIFGYRVNLAAQKAYKTTQTIAGNTMTTGTINGESIYCQKFYAHPNEKINEIVFRIMTAGAAGLGLAQARILIYRSKLNANNEIIGGDLELDTNVNINTLTTGLKVVTGLNHTLSSNTYKNVWFMCIRNYQTGSLSLKFYTTVDIVSKLYDLSASISTAERDLGWYFTCLYTSATPTSMPVSASTAPSTTAVASTSALVAIGYSNS